MTEAIDMVLDKPNFFKKKYLVLSNFYLRVLFLIFSTTILFDLFIYLQHLAFSY